MVTTSIATRSAFGWRAPPWSHLGTGRHAARVRRAQSLPRDAHHLQEVLRAPAALNRCARRPEAYDRRPLSRLRPAWHLLSAGDTHLASCAAPEDRRNPDRKPADRHAGSGHRAFKPDRGTPTPPSTWFWAIVSAFGVGLLLTFTPCVLPMIPILSSILVGQGQDRLTKRQGAALSLAYVLGTGVTYAGAGALAGAPDNSYRPTSRIPGASDCSACSSP